MFKNHCVIKEVFGLKQKYVSGCVCLIDKCLILLASAGISSFTDTDGSKQWTEMKAWNTSILFLQVMGYIWCLLADLQQFFTGKLYVLMYQLKLPAEELLWLALSCTGDPSIPMRDMRIMTEFNASYKMNHSPSLSGGKSYLCSMFMCSDSYHDTCCFM